MTATKCLQGPGERGFVKHVSRLMSVRQVQWLTFSVRPWDFPSVWPDDILPPERFPSPPAEALRNMARIVAPRIWAFLKPLSVTNYLVFVIVVLWCLVSSKCWINIWWRGIHRLSKRVHMCVCKGLDKLMEASESVAKLSQDLAVKEKELEVASVKADEVSLHLFYPARWGTFFQSKEKALRSLQGIDLDYFW